MRRVTKENLIVQIDRLYKIKDEQGQLSMNGEYTLQAYEMLLATMDDEPAPVVPEEIDRSQAIDDMRDHDESFRWDSAAGYMNGWNACRATMLNQK